MKKTNKMKKLFVLLVLILPLVVNAQKATGILYPATPHSGNTSAFTESFKNIKSINKGAFFFICGDTIWGGTQKMCKIRYKLKTYFMYPSMISFGDDLCRGFKCYDSISKLNVVDKELLYKRSVTADSLFYNNRLMQFEKFNTTCSKFGVGIFNYGAFTSSDYDNYINVYIDPYNPSSKTIKYIWITFEGYNQVNDPIKSTNGKYLVTVQCIGPLLSNGNNQYKFATLWDKNIFSYMKIKNVKVQYMDKTMRNVINPDKIILDNMLSEYLSLKKDIND